MAQNRYYSNGPSTTLTNAISDSATTVVVGSVTGWPTSKPYTIIFDPDTAYEEVATVTASSGTSLTVSRGADNTTALSHVQGATVVHGVSARDFDEAGQHIGASTNVHGLASGAAVVGTSSTQALTNKDLSDSSNSFPSSLSRVTGTETLTNKTLTTPTIGDFTNANHTHGSAAQGGNLAISATTGLQAALDALDTRVDATEADITALESATAATDWTTTGFSIASGWTLNGATSYYKFGPFTALKVLVTRSGADISLISNENISDTDVFAAGGIPAAARPSKNWPCLFAKDGTACGQGFVNTNGQLVLQTMSAGSTLQTGQTVEIGVVYPNV